MNSGVLDVNISDHQPIFVTRKHSSKIKMKTNFEGRSYIDFDEEIFCANLLETNWDQLYDTDDVDVAWDYFISKITLITNILCPLKNFKIKNLKDPWITNEILENIIDKDTLL